MSGQTSSSNGAPVDDERIEDLFRIFEGRYRKLWLNQYSTANQLARLFDDWAAVLAEFSNQEIERAVIKSATAFPTFPPNSGQFALLCRVTPEEVGLPSVELALTFAQRGQWRKNPAVWAASQALDVFSFGRMSAGEQSQAFGKVYAQLAVTVFEARKIDPGFELPQPPKALPKAKPVKRGDADIALQHTQQMLSILQGASKSTLHAV